MEVFAAGGKVGAGQPLIRQSRAVRAAADRDRHWLRPGPAHGLLRRLDQVEVGQDLFFHIVIAVFDLRHKGPLAVDGVQVPAQVLHEPLSFFKERPVVVADDEAHLRAHLAPGKIRQVVKALVPLRVGGGLGGGQAADELTGQQRRVLHLVFGGAGVDVHAFDRHPDGGGVEILIFDLAQRAAVHGIGEGRAEFVIVEVVRAPADLLVRGQADRHAPVADLRVGLQEFHGGDDLRRAGLVVGAKQGCAVGDDQLLPHVFCQALKGIGPDGLGVGQGDIPALIDHALRVDIVPGGVRRGIHVGDEADGVLLRAVGGGGQIGVDVAHFVHLRFHAHGVQLVGDMLPQQLLPLRGGHGLAVFVRGGIIGNVFQKTVFDGH